MEFVRSYDSIRFGLPTTRGGSAPALSVSGPARRSLTLRPARSPSRLATLCTRGFSSLVASTAALIATGWSEPVPGRVYPRCGPPPFHGAPEDADYEGVRVTFVAYLERAKIPIQIDIGFGDIVTPPPSETGYPTLLEFPGPRLLAYPKESVVAEKLQVLVKLGIANTRMKDFYDLEILSRTFAFEGKTLAQAIQNTFQKRGTDLPMGGLPVAFTSEFYDDLNKKRQWDRVLREEQALRREG
jgi:Nucleotidyl transferase AbiEii toxin, Type IV TA system